MPPWKAKVVAQQLFSHLPRGERVNYVFQHLTGGLPINDDDLRGAIGIAEQHLDGLSRYSAVTADEAQFFEFGAGWDLHVAQVLYCMGVNRQLVVDIRPLLREDLVFDIRDRLVGWEGALNRRPPTGETSLGAYLSRIGIEYRAPCDARATGLDDGSVDFITSTNTLEHIPADDIRRILTECHRILGDRGAMSCQIDYKDHYSYFDSRLSAYNFLRYSDRQWSWFNPDLHFQNRLRHPDYLALLDEARFQIVDVTTDDGTAGDRATIEHLDLATRFRAYSVDDLAVRKSVVVLTTS